MHLDTELLSRIQFAFTVTFHILFPAFSIGMATFLTIMELAWLKTKNPNYLCICRFWTKIFALTFGMGIVSGIVMEFQLGTNWAGYTYAAGPVLGALFTYEVLTAFFIEAGFLGVMIFGWDKVNPKLHFLATFLVLIGVTLSAFWILSANSWMQAPAGVTFTQGHFQVTDWWQVVFNPLVLPRFLHMLLAAWITTATVIAGIHAYYLLKHQHIELSKICLKFAVVSLFFFVPLQIFMGDTVGRKIYEYQPIKSAAIEAVWHTEKGAPLLLFAIPDQNLQKNLFAIGIPHLGSLLNLHQWGGEFQGLNSVPIADQPNVFIVFWTFRIMVGAGLIMLLMGIIGTYLLFRKKLPTSKNYLRLSVLFAPIGFIGIVNGWFTAEMGRQPYVIYHYLRTVNANSNVPEYDVIISLLSIIFVYGIVFGIFYFRYLFQILKAGPKNLQPEQPFAYMAENESIITTKGESL